MKETVCRSIALLNMLGIAETKAKKGTILVTGEIQGSISPASFDFSDPLIQQRLALCMDAIQIMALSAGICAKSFTPVTEEWLHRAEEKLFSASLHSLNPRSVQLLMDYMIQFAPCHSLSCMSCSCGAIICMQRMPLTMRLRRSCRPLCVMW